MALTKDSIPSLPWPKVANLCNKLIAARAMTWRAFSEEIDVDETLCHRWIRQDPPTAPRYQNATTVIAWCQKHFHNLKK